MRRIVPALGWAAVAAYFSLLAVANAVIVIDLYRPPEGPWPGWAPLIEADLLYGGLGILVTLAARWVWRRSLKRRRPRDG